MAEEEKPVEGEEAEGQEAPVKGKKKLKFIIIGVVLRPLLVLW